MKFSFCDRCGQQLASHQVGEQELCCECYIKSGNPPADWHDGCMKFYSELKLNTKEIE